MAKGNMLLGQASKKLGSVVFYKRNGQQVSRVWTDSGARSGSDASYPARVQRVRFGAASNEWKSFGYISTRMFKAGKKVTESDYNYFTKKNWQYLPYLTKRQNELGITMPIPGQYSQGNYGDLRLSIDYKEDEEKQIDVYKIAIDGYSYNDTLTWGFTVKDAVAVYKSIFPFADKVIIALGIIYGKTIIDGKGAYVNGAVVWKPVIFNLNSTDDTYLNKTIRQHFVDEIGDTNITDELSYGPEYDFIEGIYLLNIYVNHTSEDASAFKLLPLVFVTNENANDCYSTMILPGNFSVENPAFVFWRMYRTQNAFDAACSSYGYSQGVMQTRASVSDYGFLEMQSDYIKRLSTRDKELYNVYKTVADSKGIDATMTSYAEVKKAYDALSDSQKIEDENA